METIKIKPGESKIFEADSFSMSIEDNGDFTINPENNEQNNEQAS